MKVFISYSHRQRDWVEDGLVPCLLAGGADVLLDLTAFEAGKALVGQMDATQDKAEINILVLSPHYLESPYCRHEMDRAVATDPDFSRGVVIPVLLEDCALPPSLTRQNPLYVDLRTDAFQAEAWRKLLNACHADLGVPARTWLRVRDRLRDGLRRGRSANLLVRGAGVAWRGLFQNLSTEFPDLGVIDLARPTTASRHGLVAEILKFLWGASHHRRQAGGDLAELERALAATSTPARMVWTHFDLAAHRQTYDLDFFAALRYFVTEQKKLVLVIQSRAPIATLLPSDHPLSALEVETIELSS